jgi:hypothetical protein
MTRYRLIFENLTILISSFISYRFFPPQPETKGRALYHPILIKQATHAKQDRYIIQDITIIDSIRNGEK